MHFISTFLLVFPFFFRSNFFLNPYSGSGAAEEEMLEGIQDVKYQLTFHLQVGLGREIIALSDGAGVPSTVIRLGLLDDQ